MENVYNDRMDASQESNGLIQNLQRDMKQIVPSFRDALNKKDYKAFLIKSTGVVVGSFLTAQGVYHFGLGAKEQVQNPEKPNEQQTNYTHMFLGAMTTFFGASMLYLALTSPLKLKR